MSEPLPDLHEMLRFDLIKLCQKIYKQSQKSKRRLIITQKTIKGYETKDKEWKQKEHALNRELNQLKQENNEMKQLLHLLGAENGVNNDLAGREYPIESEHQEDEHKTGI